MRFNFNITVISLYSLLISFIRAEEAEAGNSALADLLRSQISEKLTKFKDESLGLVEKPVNNSQEAVNNAPKESSGEPNPNDESKPETNEGESQ